MKRKHNRNRFWIMLLIVAVAIGMAIPAAAGKPTKPEPSSPAPVPGFSCVDAAVYYGIGEAGDPWNGEGTRTVTLTRDRPNVCIDLSNDAAGSLVVTVKSPFNGVRTVTANARDSSPGDHCAPGLVLNLRKDVAGTIEDIPEATLNACGTDYSEAHFEGDDVVEIWEVDPDVDDPLAVGVGIFGKPAGPVNVTLEFVPTS
jgi:hypothetical protein